MDTTHMTFDDVIELVRTAAFVDAARLASSPTELYLWCQRMFGTGMPCADVLKTEGDPVWHVLIEIAGTVMFDRMHDENGIRQPSTPRRDLLRAVIRWLMDHRFIDEQWIGSQHTHRSQLRMRGTDEELVAVMEVVLLPVLEKASGD